MTLRVAMSGKNVNRRPNQLPRLTIPYSQIRTHREIVMEGIMNPITDKPEVVEVFSDGVIKSDTAISEEIQTALKEAVVPLEDVPAERKDYHPGSNNTVVDLLHPSLFLVRLLGLDDCLKETGEGKVIPVPPKDQTHLQTPKYEIHPRHPDDPPEFNIKFQWLSCEVELVDNGDCQKQSYINNAHPVKHKALYQAVEKALARTIPLWEASLADRTEPRISLTQVEFEEGWEEKPDRPEEVDGSKYEDEMEQFYKNRRVKVPDAGELHVRVPDNEVDFKEHLPGRNLQVIVKLANIELTPEKPRYEGGSWHIEGQLMSPKNITSSSLSFRHRADTYLDDVQYEQDNHHQFLQQVYGFPDDIDGRNDGQVTQERGGIDTREGRLITFPNTLQHRVSPFSLEDPTKPGHREILALFLVNPLRRVISSANVPPQQEDWVATNDNDKVNTMSLDEAKEFILELMKERDMRSETANKGFEIGAFCLCEH
ncbi:hypothetical protein BDV19DRAFT_396310 [Aspergillus venezuelensis]